MAAVADHGRFIAISSKVPATLLYLNGDEARIDISDPPPRVLLEPKAIGDSLVFRLSGRSENGYLYFEEA